MQKNTFILPLVIIMSLSLSGCLETLFGGAAATTMSFAKDRPAGDTLTDIKISARIKGELIKSNFRKIYSRVTVEVVQGRVLLAGMVEKEEYMLTAVQVAWNQQGVVEVINEMKVDERSRSLNLMQYTRDSLITSQVKSKMIVSRDIKAVNITVITINDVVYLFGIARSEEELEKAAHIAANVHGVKKVISHVQVKAEANKVRNGKEDTNLLDDDIISKQEADELFEYSDQDITKTKLDEDEISFHNNSTINNEDW